MSQKNILVAGATGRQGQAFISALRDCDYFHILALTRNPSSRKAKWLASESKVTIIEGDLDSEASIRSVFENTKSTGGGIWGVFCVLAFPGLGVNADSEERQGKVLADISLEYGVSCFVFSSVERGGESSDDVLMLDRLAKARIERHLRGLGSHGLAWTILRPGFFMENYEGIVGAITVSVLKAGLPKDTTIQLVCVDDIGHVAAGVFRVSCQDPALYAFQILLVAGEVSTIFEQEDVFRRRTGRDLPSVPVFVGKILLAINGHTQGLVADIKRVHRARITGECPDEDGQMAATRQAYHDMTTFAKWAELRSGSSVNRSQGWNRLQSESSCQDGSSR
ncbi:NAD(P)-binding protein [Armillaria borealis]|uniref:NAD(P)-binding protein n=1 Tax=Armillaria borealis TaxID=47425 RepID=A0AA39MWA7_9AGAR|nr:NAD(P)-binding protein [Armillaria borealis]